MPVPLQQKIVTEVDARKLKALMAELRRLDRQMKGIADRVDDVGDGAEEGFRRMRNAVDEAGDKAARTQRRFLGLRDVMRTVFAGIAAVGIGQLIQGLTRVSAELLNISNNALEVDDKFSEVFRTSTNAVDEYIAKNRELFALTERQSKEFAAQAGAITQGFGAGVETSATLSQSILSLAGDLQSFTDVPFEEAFGAIRSGLTGEQEPLKRFGIVLTEQETKLRAMATTGKQSADALTNLEKAQARLALITEKAGQAVGNAAETFSSNANRTRRLTAFYQEQRDVLAKSLAPAVTELIGYLEDLREEYEAAGASFTEDFAGGINETVRQIVDLAREVQNLSTTVRTIIGDVEGADNVFATLAEGAFFQFNNSVRQATALLDSFYSRYLNVKGAAAGFAESVGLAPEGSADAARQEAVDFRRTVTDRYVRNPVEDFRADKLAQIRSDMEAVIEQIETGALTLGAEQLDALAEGYRAQVRAGGDAADIYADGLKRLRAFRQEQAAASGPAGTTQASDREVRAQMERLAAARKTANEIRKAAEIEDAFGDRQKAALKEVYAQEERINDIVRTRARLGEEATAAEREALALAEEQAITARDAARARLDGLEEYERRIQSIAEGFRGAQVLGPEGNEQVSIDRVGYGRTGATPLYTEGQDGRFEIDAKNLQVTKDLKKAFEELRKAEERLTKETEDRIRALRGVGSTLGSLGDAVGAFGRLGDALGVLDERASQAVGGLGDVTSNLGNLFNQAADAGGFGNLLSSASGIAGAVVPGLGAAAGVVSTVSAIIADDSALEREIRRLAGEVYENSLALEDNTDALFTEAQVGAGVSEEDLERAFELVRDLERDPDISREERTRRLTELEDLTGIGGISTLAQSIDDFLEKRVDVGGIKEADALVGLSRILGVDLGKDLNAADTQEIINGLLFGDEGTRNELIDYLELDDAGTLSDEFDGLIDDFERLQDELGSFTDTVDGATERLQFLQENDVLSGDAAADSFIQDLLDIEGISGAFEEQLREAAALDVDTEEGQSALRDLIRRIATERDEGGLSLGSISAAELARILDTLRQFTEGAEGASTTSPGDEYTTSAGVDRGVTTYQANLQLALMQEQTILQRAILDALAGPGAARSAVGGARTGDLTAALTSGAGGDAARLLEAMNLSLTEQTDLLRVIASGRGIASTTGGVQGIPGAIQDLPLPVLTGPGLTGPGEVPGGAGRVSVGSVNINVPVRETTDEEALARRIRRQFDDEIGRLRTGRTGARL